MNPWIVNSLDISAPNLRPPNAFHYQQYISRHSCRHTEEQSWGRRNTPRYRCSNPQVPDCELSLGNHYILRINDTIDWANMWAASYQTTEQTKINTCHNGIGLTVSTHVGHGRLIFTRDTDSKPAFRLFYFIFRIADRFNEWHMNNGGWVYPARRVDSQWEDYIRVNIWI